MADDESKSREGAAMTQEQFALLMGAFSASHAREWRRDSPSFALRFDLDRRTPQRRLLSGHDMRSPISTSARATTIKRRSMPKWTRGVVQEYTADELTEEKRIEKAERTAELKRRKKKASSAQSSRSRPLSVSAA